MKKAFNLFLMSLLVFGFIACEKPPQEDQKDPEKEENPGGNEDGKEDGKEDDGNDNQGDSGNLGDLEKFDFPYFDAFRWIAAILSQRDRMSV